GIARAARPSPDGPPGRNDPPDFGSRSTLAERKPPASDGPTARATRWHDACVGPRRGARPMWQRITGAGREVDVREPGAQTAGGEARRAYYRVAARVPIRVRYLEPAAVEAAVYDL